MSYYPGEPTEVIEVMLGPGDKRLGVKMSSSRHFIAEYLGDEACDGEGEEED